MKKWMPVLLAVIAVVCAVLCIRLRKPPACSLLPQETGLTAAFTAPSAETETETVTTTTVTAFAMEYVQEYCGTPYCEINNSLPFFKEQERTTTAFEYYSPLDALGRCGECSACIGLELLPDDPRGSIGAVKPSGWQIVRYDGLIEGNYLFNRCHLIAHMLTGQNANECNLITGTRYLNTEGMLPFEILTADYICATGNHVLYRVTPIFEGENPIASGVLMEALSVEDDGAGLCFNVYCYNVQPQIEIDYATGESRLIGAETEPPAERSIPETAPPQTEPEPPDRQLPAEMQTDADYILNTNTMRFHLPSCQSAADISERNRQEYSGDREALIAEGYLPCQRCKP